ncbi:Dothistromin biosynthesis peroxidase dotB [Pseudocercospora fuligena]|uniref:Dothistromin biosynthesis peroxidase dotB n=1 Tax=Pseudocercospora fuligena TaxID=685502 RepID=A0A8H6VLH0_9PEZI|nr:Dothistromin biosynthesis peroxidase dotB [Pseudocercospora fuligena]
MPLTMKHSILGLCLSLHALAYPFVPENIGQKRQVPTAASDVAKALSKARTNCGNIPCLTFNEKDQYVSTTGDHAYASPAADEIRGPCPGLNAAANHGYLSRSGVTTLTETIVGMEAAFGMGPGLAGFLGAYAIIMNGDPVLGTWSIGGPPPGNALTSGLLGQAQGISYAHNTYESDMSIARPDAYINNGDAHSLDLSRFKQAYETGMSDDRYTLDGLAQDFAAKGKQSVETNPYFFSSPFAGVIVAPAAYFFVINLMSNHSAAEPSGWLDGKMFKEFFAVEGEYPDFRWLPGQERIPENWYRRPTLSSYDIPNADSDLGVQYAAYPESFYLGGNTNGVNTFTGVQLEDLTGGAMNAANLFDPKNPKASCFYAQLAQSLIPDSANLLLSELSPITSLVADFIKPITSGLDCPIVDKFDQSLFNQYPGQKYRPTGPATNY